MSAPDISRPRMETLALSLRIANEELVAEIILALCDALDAAERDRDEALGEAKIYRDDIGCIEDRLEAAGAERDASDATGYERGVRDAADLFKDEWRSWLGRECAFAILAMLPEKKETDDAE